MPTCMTVTMAFVPTVMTVMTAVSRVSLVSGVRLPFLSLMFAMAFMPSMSAVPMFVCPLVRFGVAFTPMLVLLPVVRPPQLVLMPVMPFLIVSGNRKLHARLQFFRMFVQRMIFILVRLNNLVREGGDVFVARVLVMAG